MPNEEIISFWQDGGKLQAFGMGMHARLGGAREKGECSFHGMDDDTFRLVCKAYRGML